MTPKAIRADYVHINPWVLLGIRLMDTQISVPCQSEEALASPSGLNLGFGFLVENPEDS